jgi:hypothetical protein
MILEQPTNAGVDPSQPQLSGAFKGKAWREGISNMDRCVDCGAKAAFYYNGILFCLPCLSSRDAAMLVMRPEKKKAESEQLLNSRPPTPGTQM